MPSETQLRPRIRKVGFVIDQSITALPAHESGTLIAPPRFLRETLFVVNIAVARHFCPGASSSPSTCLTPNNWSRPISPQAIGLLQPVSLHLLQPVSPQPVSEPQVSPFPWSPWPQLSRFPPSSFFPAVRRLFFPAPSGLRGPPVWLFACASLPCVTSLWSLRLRFTPFWPFVTSSGARLLSLPPDP